MTDAPKKDEKEKKPEGAIRWSYLAPRLVLLALIWLFCFFLFDPILKRVLIKSAQAAVGAKVELGDVSTRFFPPSVRLSKFALADPSDPMRNLLEFDEARFSLEGGPLLKRRFIVDDAAILGVQWDTARKDSGALAGVPPSQLAARIKALGGRGTGFRLEVPKIADVKVEAADLESVKLAEAAKDRWPKRFQEFERRAGELETRADDIKQTVDKAGRKNPLEKLKAVKKAADQVSKLKKDLDALKSELDGASAAAKADVAAVEAARRKDVAGALDKLKLPSFDAKTITEALLGPALSGKIASVVGWVRRAREFVPPTPATAKPERQSGVDVEFPERDAMPSWLLRKAELTGTGPVAGELVSFKGLAGGFTSNAKLFGKAATVDLRAEGSAKAALEAILNHAIDVPEDQVSLIYAGLPVGAATLGDPSRFAVDVSSGLGTIDAKIKLTGEKLSGRIDWKQGGALEPRLPAGTDERIARIVRSALAGASGVQATVELSGTVEEPGWSVSSNLGSALAGGLQAALGKEADEAKQRVQAKIDAELKGRLDELKKMVEEKPKELLGKIGLSQSKLPKL